jgi:hypothetical protein
MLKYLRITVTALSLMACVLLVALWVRSYWGREFLGEYLTLGQRYELFSFNGKLLILKQERFFAGAEFRIAYPDDLFTERASQSRFGVSYSSDGLFAVLAISYWLLTSFAIGLAAAPWLKWRFSLRALLIGTALVALMLGMIASSN